MKYFPPALSGLGKLLIGAGLAAGLAGCVVTPQRGYYSGGGYYVGGGYYAAPAPYYGDGYGYGYGYGAPGYYSPDVIIEGGGGWHGGDGDHGGGGWHGGDGDGDHGGGGWQGGQGGGGWHGGGGQSSGQVGGQGGWHGGGGGGVRPTSAPPPSLPMQHESAGRPEGMADGHH